MGFKKTSDTIAISFGLNESAANTFTQEEVLAADSLRPNDIAMVSEVFLKPMSVAKDTRCKKVT